MLLGGSGDVKNDVRIWGNCLVKGPELVPWRTGSGTGPIVGATVIVALLRQVQVCRYG